MIADPRSPRDDAPRDRSDECGPAHVTAWADAEAIAAHMDRHFRPDRPYRALTPTFDGSLCLALASGDKETSSVDPFAHGRSIELDVNTYILDKDCSEVPEELIGREPPPPGGDRRAQAGSTTQVGVGPAARFGR